MQPSKGKKRLIAVGDVHGQFEAFVKILQHAGLIDEQLNWTQTHDRLVQIGDIYDRGPAAEEAVIPANEPFLHLYKKGW